MAIRNFRELLVWQKGRDIGKNVYKLTQNFPTDERYGMVSQMRRAAVSITSNIAEGFYRYQKKDFQRFLSMALGSCAELENQVEISTELGFMTDDKRAGLLSSLEAEVKMLKSLIKKLDLN